MSWDVSIVENDCPHCRHNEVEVRTLNITYNLSQMLAEAGFQGWRNVDGMNARLAGEHMLKVLDGMKENPGYWRSLNPPNRWGSYDGCVQGRMRKFAKSCTMASPTALIRCS